MKIKMNVFGALAIAAISVPLAFSGKEAKTVEAKADPVTHVNHVMYVFNNNTAMGACTDGTWHTNFNLSSIDPTGSASLYVSSGRYRDTSEGTPRIDNYLEFGLYEETSGYPNANAASIVSSTDPLFSKLYSDISSELEGRTLINAFVTNEYVSDIEDISLSWFDTSGGLYLNIAYLLEGETDWVMLKRDDGVITYSPTNGGGTGVAGDYNQYALFSASKDASAEASISGNFTKHLRGKNAKIAIIGKSGNDRGTSNTLKLSTFVVNKAKCAKALVDAVKAGTITSSHVSYNRIVDIIGHKMLQSQANNLLEAKGESTYFAEFDDLYNGVKGSRLSLTPVVTRVYLPEESAYTYDRNPHSPNRKVMTKVDSSYPEIFVRRTASYSCDTLGGYVGTEAPVNPFWYAVTITFSEPYAFIFNENEKSSITKIFHIDETKSDFITDWGTLRSNGGEQGMCSMLVSEETKAQLNIMIKRYDKFSEADRATIAATDDDGVYTIGESVEYFRGVLNGTIHTENYGLAINNVMIQTSQIVIICLAAVSLSAIAVGVFLIKRKKEQ